MSTNEVRTNASSAVESATATQETLPPSSIPRSAGYGFKVQICGCLDVVLTLSHLFLVGETMWRVIKILLMACLKDPKKDKACADRFFTELVFWSGILMIVCLALELILNYDLLCALWNINNQVSTSTSRKTESGRVAKLWRNYNLVVILLGFVFFVLAMIGLEADSEATIGSGFVALLALRMGCVVVVFLYAKQLNAEMTKVEPTREK